MIAEGISIGKNACIFGETTIEDYTNNMLESGKTLVKAGDEA